MGWPWWLWGIVIVYGVAAVITLMLTNYINVRDILAERWNLAKKLKYILVSEVLITICSLFWPLFWVVAFLLGAREGD